MKRKFTARVWHEFDMYVAQCLEIDVASQGETEQKAVEMLKEALELYFEEPDAGTYPEAKTVKFEVDAA
ncbi:MAG: type II toxin-antitoxin system HicB family antitoxin [Candidatus Poribacteria bacterium]|nr:type II toxin-antitoxin system HicB family antitoxin [Candidatus Poribacteria bacterium]